jgi:hypothetical protein
VCKKDNETEVANGDYDKMSFIELVYQAQSALTTLDKHLAIAERADVENRDISTAKMTLINMLSCLDNAESLSYELRENLYD